MDRGAWGATVHGVTKSQTQLSEHTRSGIRCCADFSLVVESGGYSLDVVHGFLIGEASLVMEHRLWDMQVSVVVTAGLKSTGSIAVAHGLSCSLACGIFLDQGLNLCLLRWQVDSLPLSHQGSPCFFLFRCGYFIPVLLGFQVVISIYSTGVLSSLWHRISWYGIHGLIQTQDSDLINLGF